MAALGGFNGTTLVWDSNTLLVRNFSESGNGRAQIDITSSSDTRKKSLPGLAEPRTFSFECVYEADLYDTLQTKLADTSADTLALSFQGTATEPMNSSKDAWLIGLELGGDIDNPVTINLEFLISE